jgi:hypothetical protein
MGVTWSRRAIRQQRDFNDVTESLEQRVVQLEGLTHQLLPTLARPKTTVRPGSSGTFEFLSGQLGGTLIPSGDEQTMHNLVSNSDIAARAVCLCSRVMLPDSGESGWVAFRVSEAQATGSHFCQGCTDEVMPDVSIRITGLKDLDDDPTFDGWDEGVNGDHNLQHSAPFSPCSPGFQFVVPDNSSKTGVATTLELVSFNFIMQSTFIQSTTNDQPLTGFKFTANFANIIFPAVAFEEQSSGVGLMTRTDGKINCDQTYSNYAEIGRLGPFSLNLSNWLANGTFEINPP